MQKNIMKMHRSPYPTIRDPKSKRKLSIQYVWIAVATAHTGKLISSGNGIGLTNVFLQVKLLRLKDCFDNLPYLIVVLFSSTS